MLTNALKFIKYNFLKFLLLVVLLFTFLIAGLFFRISYKPLNVNLITKYIGKGTFDNIISTEQLENAELQFNLLKNVLLINFYGLENYEFKNNKFGLSINIIKAEEINIGLKATKLLKNKIELSFVNFNNTEANLLLKKISDFNLNNITKSDNFLFPNKLKFLGSELSISFQNMKEYIISKNFNIEISNKKELMK